MFLAVVLCLLEGAGWVGDYIFNYRFKLLAALAMMRLKTEPIPALSDTSNERELALRDPGDGPGPADPYRIGGVLIEEAGPWIGDKMVVPDDVVKAGERRVFVIGGSAAYGFPYRYENTFAGLLDRQLGSEGIRLFNASRVGWTSGELVPLVDQVVRFYQPHAIVLFLGNNEWFHWQPPLLELDDRQKASFEQHEDTNQQSIAVLKTLAASRFLSAIEYVFVDWQIQRRRARRDEARQQEPRDQFEGHHELTGFGYASRMALSPTKYQPSEWQKTNKQYLETFESNLERMVTAAHAKRVPVILLTIPFNYRLSPVWKHRQFHFFDPEHSVAVTTAIRQAAAAQKARDFDKGLKIVETGLSLDPEPAVLYYLQAMCLEGLGRPVEAEAAYAKSREKMIGNLGSRLSVNRIILRIGKRTGATVIDVRTLFDEYGHARQRYFNIDLIHDDCHPTPLGHQLIAEVLAPLLRNPPQVPDRGE